MQNINTVAELNDAIHLLENTQIVQAQLIKDKISLIIEKLRPVNLIKSFFETVTSSPNILSSIIRLASAVATIYFSRKLFIGSSIHPVRNLMGRIIQTGMASIITKNGFNLGGTAFRVIKNIFGKKQV